MEVKARSTSTWGWRSILWGRDLFQHGLKWGVGNGESIGSVEAWIPGIQNPLRYNTQLQLGLQMKVSHLYDQHGNCRLPLLNVLFPHQCCQSIQSIHLPLQPQNDFRIWSKEANGTYSIKSGYLLARQLLLQAKPSSSAHQKPFNTFQSYLQNFMEAQNSI